MAVDLYIVVQFYGSSFPFIWKYFVAIQDQKWLVSNNHVILRENVAHIIIKIIAGRSEWRKKSVVALETCKWWFKWSLPTTIVFLCCLGATEQTVEMVETVETSSTDHSWWHSSWPSSADSSNITMNNINLRDYSPPSIIFWFYNVILTVDFKNILTSTIGV